MIKTVNVTERDIRLGCKGEPENCPVWRAVRRITPKSIRVSVTTSAVYFLTPDRRLTSTFTILPSEVQTFIYRFDNGGVVSPFRFNLDIPDAIFTETAKV